MDDALHFIPTVLLAALVSMASAGCDGADGACNSDGDCPGQQVCSQSGGVLFGGGVCLRPCGTDASAERCRSEGGTCRNGYCYGRTDASDAGGEPDDGAAIRDTEDARNARDTSADGSDAGDVCESPSDAAFCLTQGAPCDTVQGEDQCGIERKVDCTEFIDFETDPDHCGECDNTCQYQGAMATCDDGTCALAACETGYVDLDGDADNGCECEVSDSEVCGDGKDNDCDGTVDDECPCDYRGRSEGICGEASTSQAGDCQEPDDYEQTEQSCKDDIDNDCDGDTDTSDDDCPLKSPGDECSSEGECQSGTCTAPDSSSSKVCAHRLFITSDEYTADLGGLTGADSKCQTLAEGASLGGTWKAVLSTKSTDAKDRLAIDGPVINLQDDPLADDATDLWSGSLKNPIEGNSGSPAASAIIWTGTDEYGMSKLPVCHSWSTASSVQSGTVGNPTATSEEWIRETKRPCDQMGRVYCIDGQD